MQNGPSSRSAQLCTQVPILLELRMFFVCLLLEGSLRMGEGAAEQLKLNLAFS